MIFDLFAGLLCYALEPGRSAVKCSTAMHMVRYSGGLNRPDWGNRSALNCGSGEQHEKIYARMYAVPQDKLFLLSTSLTD